MAEGGGIYGQYLTKEQEDELRKTANTLVVSGKGILAADESIESIGQRFGYIGLENTAENRRKYRQLLFSTAVSEFISGAVLTDELFHQKDDKAVQFPQLLQQQGVIPGIKVDKGVVPLAGTIGEQITQGMDDLATRCKEYFDGGCRFATWRYEMTIGPHSPSHLGLLENANIIARYSSICQQAGLVPVVECEILQEGDHDIDQCQKMTELSLSYMYKSLADHHVFLEGSLLKPNMVTPGQSCSKIVSAQEIAQATITALQRVVPSAVPGIVFSSGNLSEICATINLNAINEFQSKKPWALSFSYGRAMQESVLKAWKGIDENLQAGQQYFYARAKANSLATLGKYEKETVANLSNTDGTAATDKSSSDGPASDPGQDFGDHVEEHSVGLPPPTAPPKE